MKRLNNYINEWKLTNDTSKNIEKKEVIAYKEHPKTTSELINIIISRLQINNECPYLLDIDTSNITDMRDLFAKDTLKISSINANNIKKIDIHTWDTSNVYTMDGMFDSLYNLEYVDMSNLSIDSLKSTLSMFYACRYLKKIKGIEEWKYNERLSAVTIGTDMFFYVNPSAIPTWFNKYSKPV